MMKVFKFGGASVKDAESVKNVASIISIYEEPIVVVVSAMNKMTNRFEHLLSCYIKGDDIQPDLEIIRSFHDGLLEELHGKKTHLLDEWYLRLNDALSVPPGNYSFDYDRIVSFGELMSTTIIADWLQKKGQKTNFLDARELIITNNHHRRATVNWELTTQRIKSTVQSKEVSVVQGFIGADENGNTTTLGREGSDYTASVFAHCLDAESVTIWKDVPGILNGDPKVFDNTIQLKQISYREAIELAYFGASVIHPKTIQPVQHKSIPLYIRSFVDPQSEPTSISKGLDLDPVVPCYIRKTDQALITLATPDLAFIVENHLSLIYQIFHEAGVTVNMMQNSAISTSFCVNNDLQILPAVILKLKDLFQVKFNKGLELLTIRHPDEQSINSLKRNKNVLLEQVTRQTYQMVVS